MADNVMWLAAFLLCKLIWTVWTFFQETYWRWLHGPKAKGLVRVMKIRYRLKRLDTEVGRKSNFVVSHEFFRGWSYLVDDPHWMLYTFTTSYVYFVRLPHEVLSLNIKVVPFLYQYAYRNAERVARMRLETFYQMTREKIGEPKCSLVFFTNTPRCGSTLLGQMLQHEGHSVVLGEMAATETLTSFYFQKIWPEETLKRMFEAMVSFTARQCREDTTLIFKTTSREARLVPIAKAAVPKMKNIFLFRKSSRKAVERMMRSVSGTPHQESLMQRLSFAATMWSGTYGQSEEMMHAKDHAFSVPEVAQVVYLNPYRAYLDNIALFDTPAIMYRDLINKPVVVLERVFRICGIPIQCMNAALACLSRDSQAGTEQSQEAISKVSTTETDEQMSKKLIEIAQKIGFSQEEAKQFDT